MKVKMILPALTEATSPFWRPIKYSLFPPLGLATLAAYLDDDDEVEIQDEHVERLDLDDAPDLVVIQVYITSAYRAYRIADHYRARGAYVALGGLHVTSLPEEAARARRHDFPRARAKTRGRGFSRDFRRGAPERVYRSTVRTLAGVPPIRRDLIKRRLYLVPNSIVVSRGCPHVCDFCYKEAFFEGGRVVLHADGRRGARRDRSAARPSSVLPRRSPVRRPPLRVGALRRHARHGPPVAGRRHGQRGARARPARAGGRGRAAQPVRRIRDARTPANLAEQRKYQNLRRDYGAAIRRLHDLGVMINGSFVFGMDGDDASVFERTVEWAIEHGIETATFHILTPYPGHGAASPHGRSGAHHDRRLGSATTRGTPCSGRRACRRASSKRGYWLGLS